MSTTLEQQFIKKVQNNNFGKLTNKEIDIFIDEYWLAWTMKYELLPMGHLTLSGKRTLIDGYSEEIKNLINEFC